MVDVLKFQTLVARQTVQIQIRLRGSGYLPICYSDKNFMNSGTDNQHFKREQKEKSVRNFRTFIKIYCLRFLAGMMCRFYHPTQNCSHVIFLSLHW